MKHREKEKGSTDFMNLKEPVDVRGGTGWPFIDLLEILSGITTGEDLQLLTGKPINKQES